MEEVIRRGFGSAVEKEMEEMRECVIWVLVEVEVEVGMAENAGFVEVAAIDECWKLRGRLRPGCGERKGEYKWRRLTSCSAIVF